MLDYAEDSDLSDSAESVSDVSSDDSINIPIGNKQVSLPESDMSAFLVK